MFNDDLLTYLENFITEERKQRFLDVLAERTKFLTVAIEDVYQLHNTSAVIRSCDAFGVQEIHVIEDKFGKRLDKNIAMGAEQWVDVNRYTTTSDCIRVLKDEGYTIIATTPHDNSTLLSNFEFKTKIALFFGTEKEGLSNEVLQKANSFLKIPMVGFSESLNVSVSAAIIIQKLVQCLKNSQMQWQLSDIEILEKRMDWTKKSIKDVERIIERFQLK
ncbi:tRNA (guanosine(18)-2'-O)-methyltransferase [Flagellimonas maritima]|uniref:tRNA (guanosine(18)-2'-O)-methyltransferase n=1 Tax=Flagellimonas maritima TaxID=1383885 RepID=A0A2Z4LMU5_9FLAO|nr:RNA methyltransferase [Allomuricauda aurantiaca]AWX43066.1 tRNA (guanosine(18)-2'-O)-methyltransferase [Allomuricauda aurantiaca]